MQPLATLQIGGGIGSLIGQTHRIAMHMDRRFNLVGGIFNSTHEKSLQMAEQLGLQPDRTYPDFETLVTSENKLGDGRADCISICTPNETHYSYCKAALNAGFHVVCDKPIAGSVEEAEELETIALDRGLILAVTYNYSGYPMVREARERILKGEIGRPYIINVEMPQAAVSKLKITETIEPRMRWRLDLAKTGGSLVLLDLMTHVIQMAEYVSGQTISHLSAACHALNNDHGVDDNAVLSCKFENGAIGHLWASFVATGTEHGLSFQIFGESGSLHWQQVDPNYLTLKKLDATEVRFNRASDNLSDFAQTSTRIQNHPEGFFEAFANIYTDVANAITACNQSGSTKVEKSDYIHSSIGTHGLKIVAAAQKSSAESNAWVKV